MRAQLDLGASPPYESCAQVGSNDYVEQARRECRAYINQLRRAFGPEPLGAQLSVRSNPHDFGTYYSVVCYFDEEHPESIDYAYRCEGSESPREWDELARAELQLGPPTL